MKTEMARILVADDNMEDLSKLLEILKEEGYHADGVSNGDEALEKLGSGDYEMVITDLKMPKKDGLELLEKIGKQYSKVAVMVITGYPSLDSSIQSLRGEALDYIVKPYDVQYLKERIANCLERIRSRGEMDFAKVGKAYALTDREVEVVEQLYQGLSNAQIAANLNISEGTVKIHLEHVFRKAKVKSRTALLASLRDL